MTPMLSEYDGRSAVAKTSHHGVKKRRVLVGLDKFNATFPPYGCESEGASPVETRLATDRLDLEASVTQSFGSRPKFIQTDEDEAVTTFQPASKIARENLCAANIQAVDELTHNRTK